MWEAPELHFLAGIVARIVDYPPSVVCFGFVVMKRTGTLVGFLLTSNLGAMDAARNCDPGSSQQLLTGIRLKDCIFAFD